MRLLRVPAADIPAGLTGPAARDALQADIRPRHRRAPRIAGSLAAIVAAISVTSVSHRPAFVAAPRPTGAIMYVARFKWDDTDRGCHQHAGQADQDRCYPDGAPTAAELSGIELNQAGAATGQHGRWRRR
jgi:hypothetical protein